MCGGSSPPPPDPNIGRASLEQIEFSKQQYADYMAPGGDREWMRGITDRSLGIYAANEGRAAELANYQLAQSRRNDDRYWGTAVPYENRLIDQVDEMDSDSYREAQVTRALADTQKQSDNSRRQGIREMTRRGASPESGAYAAMMDDGGRAQAMAMATASNKTRLASQQVGLSNKMQMYGGMKGMAGLGATSAQLALGAGGMSSNAASGMMSAGGGMMNANNNAMQGRTSGVSAGIGGYNQYYGNIVGATNAANAGDQTGQVIGTVVGVAAMAF